MTDSRPPGLHPLSHLKAGPTTSSSRSTAVPASATPQPPSRPASRLHIQRDPSREDVVDSASDKTTIALIRRVLCPQTGTYGASSAQPPEELLPPLTSSNDVDRQLYAFIAIIIRDFVYSWYSKITPDQALVNEVLQVVAHCTRALEQRLRRIDVAQLVLDELPALVEAHVLTYRLAKRQSHLSGLSTSHHVLYHELNPHPGFSPVPDSSDPQTIISQRENEAIYRRLLANGTLAVLLPTEDLENSSLRVLVGDVLADRILGEEVSGRMSEGWFFWQTITKLAVAMRRKASKETAADLTTPTSRLEQFGIYVGYVVLRFIVTGLFRVASSPPLGHSHTSVSFSAGPDIRKEKASSDGATGKRPVLDYRVYSMVSQVLGVPQRMPWMGGLLSLSQHLILAGPGTLGATDGVLDRFLRETIEKYVLTPTLLPNILRATRSALFPANARPPSQITPVNLRAPSPAPQLFVQPAASTQKSLANPSVVAAAIRKPPATSSATGKSNVSNSQSHSGTDRVAGVSSPSTKADVTATHPTPSNTILDTDRTRARPSDPEIAAIKRQCATSLLSVIPRRVARTFFGVSSPAAPRPVTGDGDGTCSSTSRSSSSVTANSRVPPSIEVETGDHRPRSASAQANGAGVASSPTSPTNDRASTERLHMDQPGVIVDPEELHLLESIEQDLLDLFEDDYCNKHLVYSIVETVLARLLPELSERSIADLMEDRGVAPMSAG
ncbi:PX-associated sorting nexin 13 [Penicillium riverlandense]|uniref:PX-associated sorting nexin 13 n=1 Tax=Penicillium riverlandense TaxID=1903569 RepID=UPI0025477DD4|nr:PX-associated sorting nexin 13 [Penicillium riverlandense]KAJ5818763.1 PX-associated sorting nexin 13 [Penicillium riverlandense]